MLISTLIAGTCLRKVGPSVFCIVVQNSEVLETKESSCWDWTVVALLSDGGFELPNSPGSVLLHFSFHVVPKFSTLPTLNELWSRETFYLLFIVIYYFTTIYCQGECHHLKQNKKHHPDSSPGRGCTWARITPGHVLFVSLAVSHPSSTADVLVYKGKAVLQNKSFQWKHKSATNATSNGLCITPYLLCPLSVPLYPAHFHTNQADVWTRK